MVLRLETDLLRILQMGNYMGTCLSLGGGNAFSTVANACDLNKRVLYAANGAGTEVLVAHDGAEVANHLARLDPETSRRIGRAAFARVHAEHTYAHRAQQVEALLEGRYGASMTGIAA